MATERRAKGRAQGVSGPLLKPWARWSRGERGYRAGATTRAEFPGWEEEQGRCGPRTPERAKGEYAYVGDCGRAPSVSRLVRTGEMGRAGEMVSVEWVEPWKNGPTREVRFLFFLFLSIFPDSSVPINLNW